jgi:hypothetical protein
MGKLFDFIANIGERFAPISGKVMLNGRLTEPSSGAWVLEFERPLRISEQESSKLDVRAVNQNVENELKKFVGQKVQIKGKLATPLGGSIVLQASAIDSVRSDAGEPSPTARAGV